jgi:hypothetical protein
MQCEKYQQRPPARYIVGVQVLNMPWPLIGNYGKSPPTRERCGWRLSEINATPEMLLAILARLTDRSGVEPPRPTRAGSRSPRKLQSVCHDKSVHPITSPPTRALFFLIYKGMAASSEAVSLAAAR